MTGAHRVTALLARIETAARRAEAPTGRLVAALEDADGEAANALKRELDPQPGSPPQPIA